MKNLSTTINHGLINRLYHSDTKATRNELPLENPVYIKFSNYFQRYKGKDKYYIAMKYHAVGILLKMDLTTIQIAKCFGFKSHSSVLNLKNKYKPKKDYDKFIEENFDNYVENFIYPIVLQQSNWSIYREYKYKPTIIDKDGKKQQTPK